jgi:hypothetical protein
MEKKSLTANHARTILPYLDHISQSHIYHLPMPVPLCLRPGLLHIIASLIGIVLEILVEQFAQFRDLFLKIGAASPTLLWVEEFVGDVGALLGHVQVEDIVGFVLGFGELAAVDSVEDGAGVFKGATLRFVSM